MPKEQKISTEKSKKNRGKGFFSAIIGLGIASVIVSIAYSTTVIALGTEGRLPLIMVAPQAVFALGVLVVALVKMGGSLIKD